MSSPHGRFVWYELMTSDPDAAEKFYRDVAGHSLHLSDAAQVSYTMFTAGEAAADDLTPMQRIGARPGWLAYVGVDDVDAAVVQAVRCGGAVRRAPTDIPQIGRFAVISDPQGGTLALFKPLTGQTDIVMHPDRPLGVGWHELHTADRDEAFRFYAGLFGWTKGQILDMGTVGLYQLFGHAGVSIGGMMTKPAAMPGPFWLLYFNVDAIQPAISRVRDAGGEVLNGPHQVPGGSWVVQCLDPQGGLFALVEQTAPINGYTA